MERLAANSWFLWKTSEYPYELHDLHKDYLLAPECFQIEENFLATINVICYNMKDSASSNNLVLNLHNKTNYIIHYCNLKLYLELRLCLTNVHCALSFDQLPWLKNYINLNNHQHATAKRDFEKDLLKLMNNAVFGKSFICLFVLLFWFIRCR